MQSFAKLAKIGIKKNPEIFAALEEFETTKKIPKFSYRKRIDLTIDENVLRKFKQHCKDRGLNMSRIVEKHMQKEME